MSVVPCPADPGLDARISVHDRVSRTLAGYDDTTLSSLIGARASDVGIGGGRTRIDVDGTSVFVKCLPLTDLERAPGAAGSTANLFDLPAYCHYGVGSPGFGAWRELAATRTVSSWVLARRTENFPMLHHWRVLSGAPAPGRELCDIEASVVFWGGHRTMRERLHALSGASSRLVLFLEHIPQTLNSWLSDQRQRASDGARAAVTMLETQLVAATTFMANRGLVHFDAHFDNVLTDGHRLYVADLGLAASTDFALSDDESTLLRQACTHDIGYVIARLVNWSVSTFGDPSCSNDPVIRNDHVRAVAEGASAAALGEPVAAIVERYAPVAAIVNAFYADLFTVRRDAPYPSAAISTELARLAATTQRPNPAVDIADI